MHSEALTANVTLLTFPDRTAFAEMLAQHVTSLLQRDLTVHSAAAIAVSGGSTPAPVFDLLKADDTLDWSRVMITLADERWVPNTDPESTEKLVRERLLHPTSPFIPLFNDHPTPQAGLETTHRALQAIPLPFTAVLLGMGEDGHTASLFPHNATLRQAFDPSHSLNVIGLDDSPKPPSMRISLTYPALINTGRIILHLTGAGKIDVLNEALSDGPIEAMPIRAFLRQTQVPVDVYYAA